ncbi:hypothetical protein Y032_0058g2909 [Ancylostoma ceylanicum]|uniref:Uncharacterized protein n=1 Tax=Ancylostoma ceylanicum TaxID=53326 RepID=A0A016U5U5_9BILA|nr:hypothetical protein Y032_0058g2909 [Ancylostoma ceylanicum]
MTTLKCPAFSAGDVGVVDLCTNAQQLSITRCTRGPIQKIYSRSKKYLPPASTAHLLSRAAPPMHYHTCCDVAQSTRSVARGMYFLQRL